MSSDTVSQTNLYKRLETLLELALLRAAIAVSTLFALRNMDFVRSGVADTTGPISNQILAAANVVKKGSGRFITFFSWEGTDSAADTISIVIAHIFGPTTAFSGGSLSAFGSTIRVNTTGLGPVVATGTGATLNAATQSIVTGAGGAFGLSASSFADFGGSPAGQHNLILGQLNATHDMTGQLVNFLYFELP